MAMVSWNLGGDSDDEFEDSEFKRSSGKTALVVIISTTPDMFQPGNFENGDESQDSKPATPFKIALQCCESLWRSKIVSGKSDLVSILLCGTEKHKNSSDFNNLYVLQDMSSVKVSMIEELNSMKTSDDFDGFDDNIGSSAAYHLKDTFWLTKSIFEEAKTDSYLKKVLFFTSEDSPHASRPNLQQDAIEKFKDLGRVDFNIVSFKEDFQFEKFYSRILEDNSSVIFAKDSESLLKLVKSKQSIRRPIVRSTLEVAPGCKIAVGVYSFISKTAPPRPVKINKMTNELVEKSVNKFRKDTGMPVLKSEERKVIAVKGEEAVFEESELKRLNYVHETGISLLGFMNQSDLNFLNCYKSHSYFLYPDEERITGSREFFTSLLKRCHALEKIALVKMVLARGRKPKLGCLIPSLANDEESAIRFPQGFHLFILPYSDEIRKADVPDSIGGTETLAEIMDKIVKKLSNKKFDLSQYQNPAIQRKWRHLEKLAIETLEQDDFYDYTEPDCDLMEKRLGSLPQELDRAVESCSTLHGELFAISTALKKAPPPINMLIEYKNKRVEKLTVEILKNFLLEKGASFQEIKFKRKADLVAEVYSYFDKQQ